ncbi:MAG: hypothetical protein JXB32_04030 [Deltaproteobacteria bacterium]|nr:hypothetical protein [Deltaproteobacteria bacterium]
MSARTSAATLALAVLLASTAAGCRARRDACGDPVVVARAFVERLEGGDTERAFELLSRAARDELTRRAAEASRTMGQEVAPAELLVPERSVLVRPEWLALRSIDGDEAWIDVRPAEDVGVQHRGPWSVQRLVREDGCWRVDLFHPPPGAAAPGALPAVGDAGARGN